MNVHFHALVLDGVYTATSPLAAPLFHEAPELSGEDVERLVRTIRDRVLRLLRRRGMMEDTGQLCEELSNEHQGLLPLLQAASIQGRVAQGPDAGAPLGRLGQLDAGGSGSRPSPLCAEVDGFSLHAAVRIGAHQRERLEHLCRYIARPPLAAERLKWSRRGRLLWELRRPWRDGTTHIVLEPMALLERLAALVPPPRYHLQTYHGVLAPASSWRDELIPAHPVEPPEPETDEPTDQEAAKSPRARPVHRALWADLMRRVFGFDVLRCARCRSRRRLVSLITQPEVIVRILAHLGLATDPPPIQPARAPPQLELGF